MPVLPSARRSRFMVPVHGQPAVEALHEPRGSGAGVPPAAGASRPSILRGRDTREDSRDGCPTTAPTRFMVPMHAEKTKGSSP